MVDQLLNTPLLLRTPLQRAALEGGGDDARIACKTLVRTSADIPLQRAVLEGNMAKVKRLVARGVNTRAEKLCCTLP
jgi:hypothetical protein